MRGVIPRRRPEADPELVPGVNTCTLNNREFLTIIECRAGLAFVARSLSSFRLITYVSSLASTASCILRECIRTGVTF